MENTMKMYVTADEKLNVFWLDSSLKISPLEQVEVLSIFGSKSRLY